MISFILTLQEIVPACLFWMDMTLTPTVSHNIVAYCLPPHSIPRLQPLDVGRFGPLNQYYTQHVADLIAAGNITIQRANEAQCG